MFFNNSLDGLGLPYSFGFAIIIFTLVIKGLTFPLNQKQMKSSKATQELQPKLKVLQKKYAKDKEKLSQEQMKLYKEAGVNPLGGCLPMLVQMPIWFALYRALYQMAETEPALQEGFFWIPSLAGPTIDGARSLSWLWPFPPAVGWPDAIGYLVLPVLLVVSQLYMQKMMTPQSDDPQQKSMGQVMMFMPFMFGYFALVVPSGLSLYWFTNNLLSLAQQLFLNKQHDKEQAAKAIEAKTKKSGKKDKDAEKETTKSKRLPRDKRKAKALPVKTVEPEALEDKGDVTDGANGQPENDIEYKTSAKQVQIDVKIKSGKRKK
ncbi:MAG TPA: YidC/Oxa1 family membrane protein insertase [Chloroflexi bacterium]|nr:YidC/Oxa1 family membrane protein insertase [Chloroflexota bacterium]